MAAGGAFKTMKAMSAKFNKDMHSLDAKLEKARRTAAQKTAAHVRKNMPVAFGDLRDSVRELGTKVIADAVAEGLIERHQKTEVEGNVSAVEPLAEWERELLEQTVETPAGDSAEKKPAEKKAAEKKPAAKASPVKKAPAKTAKAPAAKKPAAKAPAKTAAPKSADKK